MAASKTNFHVRSNSFPSNTHPLLQQCNEHLERLGSSNATSSSTITNKLSGLEDLFGCVEKLVQLQFAQQAFNREEKWADQIVDSSLRLLDIWSVAKDAVLLTKESSREIQSALRRKRGDEDSLEIEIKKYSSTRKVLKKTVQKALRGLKTRVDSKSLTSQINQDNETKALVCLLREVETVTLGVFESLLSFISGPTNKLGGWSLVSILINNKRVVDESEEANEFLKVDVSLMTREKVQNNLQDLNLCVQDFEERLDGLFRHLIKTRVSLLNILNN